jgi:hypothetical protein
VADQGSLKSGAALEKILTIDNLRKDNLLWLIGVVYASSMENLLIIFFSIVRLLVHYGTPSLVALVFLGLCLTM